MEWLNGLQGITDDHKGWATQNNVDSPAKLFELATKKPSWVEGLSSEHRGLLDAKGFKEPSHMIDAYRSLESTVGAPPDKVLKLPTKSYEEAPEEWNKVYGRLGRPEKPEGYEIKVPEGAEMDKGVLDFLTKTFHELGYSKQQGQGLIQKWAQFQNGLEAQSAQANAGKKEQADLELRTLWGRKFEENVSASYATAAKLGFKPDEIQGLKDQFGDVRILKMFEGISKKIGEADYVGGNGPGGDRVLTPDGAQFRLKEIQSDPNWVMKFNTGDPEAIKERDRLMAMAYPSAPAA